MVVHSSVSQANGRFVQAMVLGGGGLLGTHLSQGDVINPHVRVCCVCSLCRGFSFCILFTRRLAL